MLHREVLAFAQCVLLLAGVAVGQDLFLLGLDTGLQRLDAESGYQPTTIAEFTREENAVGIAVDLSGDVIVALARLVVRIDPSTGVRTLVTSAVIAPSGVAIAKDNAIILVTRGTGSGFAGASVIRVDPIDGSTRVVTVGGFLGLTERLAIGPFGNAFVLDRTPGVRGAVVRVDLNSGIQTLVTSGGFRSLRDLVVTNNGDILVLAEPVDGGDDAIFRVDPASGEQEVVSAPIRGVAIALDSDQFLWNVYEFSLIRINPATGAQERIVINDPQFIANPIDIAFALDSMPGAPTINLSIPPDGFIDPRSDIGGIEQVTLTFSLPVTNVGGAPIDASAFAITSTDNSSIPGPPIVPGVFRVDVSANRKTVVVTLTHRIPVGEWTTLTADVEGPSGDPATVSVRVGHLPCDIDQSGDVTISDVSTYGIEWRKIPQPKELIDMDRSGVITPSDPSVFGLMWRGGGGATRQWAGLALPPKPE